MRRQPSWSGRQILLGLAAFLTLAGVGFGLLALRGPGPQRLDVTGRPTFAAAPLATTIAPTPPRPPPADAPTLSPAVTVAPAPPAPAAPPVHVSIPAIGVSSALVDLGLARDGTLQVPTDFATVGWYTRGPAPGEVGPAVLAGHVDSKDGPAVFFRLRELTPGAIVEVARADGSSARFRVERVEQYAKNAFPTQEVYGPDPRRALRLITCGGLFDEAAHHYRDNIVVYAVAAAG